MDNVNRLESFFFYIIVVWLDNLELFGYCFLLYFYNFIMCCVNLDVR